MIGLAFTESLGDSVNGTVKPPVTATLQKYLRSCSRGYKCNDSEQENFPEFCFGNLHGAMRWKLRVHRNVVRNQQQKVPNQKSSESIGMNHSKSQVNEHGKRRSMRFRINFRHFLMAK